jgi:8-oxo-dGTP pyrophosphatase MutT (NUDIX family)
MPIPDFVLALREKIGTDPLWLSSITAVVVRGDELLLVRRADTGAWTPVTGIIDPGEEPAAAAAREVLEEADIVATAESLRWVHTIPMVHYPNGDSSQYLDIVFRCDYVSGEPYPADGENTEAAWFNLHALPELSEDMRARIHSALDTSEAARFER